MFNQSRFTYDVFYNGPPSEITAVGFQVMKKWIAFALGRDEIAAQRVDHPTGRYASSIRMEQLGPLHVAIIADEEIAPEAAVLEGGHGPIDLKQFGGRAVPLHRGQPGAYGSAGYGAASLVSKPTSRRASGVSVVRPGARRAWAEARSQGDTGIRRIPSKITAENSSSWIIPTMNAWSPAFHLAEMIRQGEFRPS